LKKFNVIFRTLILVNYCFIDPAKSTTESATIVPKMRAIKYPRNPSQKTGSRRVEKRMQKVKSKQEKKDLKGLKKEGKEIQFCTNLKLFFMSFCKNFLLSIQVFFWDI
jgi:hypothetical protein